jgi:hypothetical protein
MELNIIQQSGFVKLKYAFFGKLLQVIISFSVKCTAVGGKAEKNQFLRRSSAAEAVKERVFQIRHASRGGCGTLRPARLANTPAQEQA